MSSTDFNPEIRYLGGDWKMLQKLVNLPKITGREWDLDKTKYCAQLGGTETLINKSVYL